MANTAFLTQSGSNKSILVVLDKILYAETITFNQGGGATNITFVNKDQLMVTENINHLQSLLDNR